MLFAGVLTVILPFWGSNPFELLNVFRSISGPKLSSLHFFTLFWVRHTEVNPYTTTTTVAKERKQAKQYQDCGCLHCIQERLLDMPRYLLDCCRRHGSDRQRASQRPRLNFTLPLPSFAFGSNICGFRWWGAKRR
jgi:hypothetical protein